MAAFDWPEFWNPKVRAADWIGNIERAAWGFRHFVSFAQRRQCVFTHLASLAGHCSNHHHRQFTRAHQARQEHERRSLRIKFPRLIKEVGGDDHPGLRRQIAQQAKHLEVRTALKDGIRQGADDQPSVLDVGVAQDVRVAKCRRTD